jgi:hypothetical protein
MKKTRCEHCKEFEKIKLLPKWGICALRPKYQTHKNHSCGVFKPRLPINKAPDMIFHVRESDKREKRMATLKNMVSFFFVLALLIVAYAAIVVSFAQAIWRN